MQNPKQSRLLFQCIRNHGPRPVRSRVLPTQDGIFTSYFPTPLEKDPRVQIETFPWPVILGSRDHSALIPIFPYFPPCTVTYSDNVWWMKKTTADKLKWSRHLRSECRCSHCGWSWAPTQDLCCQWFCHHWWLWAGYRMWHPRCQWLTSFSRKPLKFRHDNDVLYNDWWFD